MPGDAPDVAAVDAGAANTGALAVGASNTGALAAGASTTGAANTAAPAITNPSPTIVPQKFSAALNILIQESKVTCKSFLTWMEKEGYNTVELLAVVATEEKDVNTNLIEMAKGEGVRFATHGERACVKWLWKLCREAVERGSGVTASVDDGKPLASGQYQTMKTAWFNRHTFHFTTYRILGNSIMGKMHKHATASPKQFFIIFPEEMKLKSSTTKTESSSVSIKAGQLPTEHVYDIEYVTGVAALEWKIEAQFNTWAFVSIMEPAWFGYQDSIQLVDILKATFNRRYHKGARPTLEFYSKAYVQTMQYFQDNVTTFERTLADVARDLSGWIHFWTWDAAPMQPTTNVAQGNPAADVEVPSISQAVQVQMNKLNQMAVNIGKNLKGKGKGGKREWDYDNKWGNSYEDKWTGWQDKTEKKGNDKGKGKTKKGTQNKFVKKGGKAQQGW
jgi:hypothetical protein